MSNGKLSQNNYLPAPAEDTRVVKRLGGDESNLYTLQSSSKESQQLQQVKTLKYLAYKTQENYSDISNFEAGEYQILQDSLSTAPMGTSVSDVIGRIRAFSNTEGKTQEYKEQVQERLDLWNSLGEIDKHYIIGDISNKITTIYANNRSTLNGLMCRIKVSEILDQLKGDQDKLLISDNNISKNQITDVSENYNDLGMTLSTEDNMQVSHTTMSSSASAMQTIKEITAISKFHIPANSLNSAYSAESKAIVMDALTVANLEKLREKYDSKTNGGIFKRRFNGFKLLNDNINALRYTKDGINTKSNKPINYVLNEINSGAGKEVFQADVVTELLKLSDDEVKMVKTNGVISPVVRNSILNLLEPSLQEYGMLRIQSVINAHNGFGEVYNALSEENKVLVKEQLKEKAVALAKDPNFDFENAVNSKIGVENSDSATLITAIYDVLKPHLIVHYIEKMSNDNNIPIIGDLCRVLDKEGKMSLLQKAVEKEVAWKIECDSKYGVIFDHEVATLNRTDCHRVI